MRPPAAVKDVADNNHVASRSEDDDDDDDDAGDGVEEAEQHVDAFVDKRWRTTAESATPPGSARCGWHASPRPTPRRRQHFWRNIVRHFNFADERERRLVISLTNGTGWSRMRLLPREFMRRHREIYFLIATPDYPRSSIIQRDVTRTFSIFAVNDASSDDFGPQQRALFRVLNAVAEAEDGYCQGMNFIAAFFLVEGLEESDAYALFLYLLKKRHLARIYQRSSTFLDEYLQHFECMLKGELPDLYQHMQSQGFVIAMYGIEWFTTLFSLSTKPDLACAIFDLFFVGVQDVFLRVGLAILKLLEATLMCMSFEDFLRDFKTLVRQIDPYQAILEMLAMSPNPQVKNEDTTAFISRAHYLQAASFNSSNGYPAPPRSFRHHRTLPPDLVQAIKRGDVNSVTSIWADLTEIRPTAYHARVIANEILHYAVWYGHVTVATFALELCGADPNSADDTNLTPLHFSVIRNHPDIIRLLLCFGAHDTKRGGRWSGAPGGLTPLETADHWKFNDTAAARCVLDRGVCVFCNSRFDSMALNKEICPTCSLVYCRRSLAKCSSRHRCCIEAGDEQSRAEDSDMGSDTVDADLPVVTDACQLSDSISRSLGEARTSSSSLSGSMSDSSSFVFVNTPKQINRADGVESSSRRTSASVDSTGSSSSWLESVSGWLGGLVSSPSSAPHSRRESNNSELGQVSFDQVRLLFPDRPDWYCNERRCHTLFSFFNQGTECCNCSGLFCDRDIDLKNSKCASCAQSASARARATE